MGLFWCPRCEGETQFWNKDGRTYCDQCNYAETDEHDAFMAEVAAALLGPPEEGTMWGGGAILDGIRDLKDRCAQMEAALREISKHNDELLPLGGSLAIKVLAKGALGGM